jgi:hypothetical protein
MARALVEPQTPLLPGRSSSRSSSAGKKTTQPASDLSAGPNTIDSSPGQKRERSVTSLRRISENFTVQLRAEIFNILNRLNFAVPQTLGNTDIFDSTGAPTGVSGLLTSTTTTSLQIQFALKLVW